MSWETLYSEGCVIRSTGYGPSDVVEVSFTVAPEFNQVLRVQPDGCVMLKDAGLVQAQGLRCRSSALPSITLIRDICTIPRLRWR